VAQSELAKPCVLIVDTAGDERRKAMGTAFADLATVSYLLVSQGGSEGQSEVFATDIADHHLAAVPDCALVLCHWRDRNLHEGTTAGMVVYYSGSGGDAMDLGILQGERIWRPVDGPVGILSGAEAGQLLAFAAWWAAHNTSTVPLPREVSARRPTFLKPLERNEILSALAILCQGFFVARMSGTGLSGRREAVSAATLMGLDESALNAIRSTFGAQFRTAARDVLYPPWWTPPFAHLPLPLSRMLEFEWSHGYSGELSNDLRALTDWINGPVDVEANELVIGAAFSAIAKRLGSQRGA
jgi:hypothetical protein